MPRLERFRRRLESLWARTDPDVYAVLSALEDLADELEEALSDLQKHSDQHEQ